MDKNLSTIYQRIDKVLIDKGLTKPNGRPNYAKAERMCGMKGTVLSKAIIRKGSLSDANKEKFLRTFHVNPEWFETGKGDIYQENLTSEGSKQTNDNPANQRHIDNLRAWLNDKQKIIEAQERELQLCQRKLAIYEARIKELVGIDVPEEKKRRMLDLPSIP